MTRNFQIEEIVSQDEHGVAFIARETATGRHVLLTRFFPFGRDGGGLPPPDRPAFEERAARLRRLAHPGLRAVVGGGCDPADGIPFLAAEPLDGRPLATVLNGGTLPAEEVRGLLERILELCALVSHQFEFEDLWVDTDPAAVVVCGGDPPRGAVFTVSAWKCAGVTDGRPRWEPLAVLAEELCGWRGGEVAADAGGGLGRWVGWLRAHPDASLRQVCAQLSGGAPEAEPLSPARAPVPPPPAVPAPDTRVARPPANRHAGILWAGALLAVALLLAGGWWAIRLVLPRAAAPVVAGAPAPSQARAAKPATRPVAAAAPTPQPAPTPALASHQAAEPDPPAARPQAPAAPPSPAGSPPASERSADLPAGVFDPRQRDEILAHFHHEAAIEGVLVQFRLSANQKIWYLEFSQVQPPDRARAFLYVSDGARTITPADLQPLVGKRVRLRGNVDAERIHGVRSPKLIMPGWQALTVLE